MEEASKNLEKLLNSQMSARDKKLVRIWHTMNEMSNNSKTDSDIVRVFFDVRSSNEESTPANDRFSKADGYHAVPPPITGNFLTARADISFAGLDEYAIRKKIIESKTTDLNTKPSETVDDEDDVFEVQTVSLVKTNKTKTVTSRVDKIDQTSQKQGISFKKIKACFVCKSIDHLIKDYNFHNKQSQEPKMKTVVNTGPRVDKPVRNQMMTYLKHVRGKKHANLKNKNFEEIQVMYKEVTRYDKNFIVIGSAEDERQIKEMNKEFKDPKKKILKKRVVNETPREEDTTKVPAEQEVTEHDDDSDDEYRKCLRIVTFDSTIDSEIIETKSFVSKLHKVSSPDGDYLVVYRVNGHFRAFNYLMEVLHIFDRQDLFHLYDLVMKQYSEITPEGIELILWGDLKIMMESSTEENNQGDFWNNQQDWDIVSWRLYEACGFCILELKDGIVIYMLVERRYPLSKELLQRMLDLGLEVEEESTAALHLNITSRFQQNPGDLHWTTVKNIMKYLKNTKDMFLVYGGDLKRELIVSCYTNAGYLTDADNLKSQTGYVFVLNGGDVDWKSSKQSIFTTSSAEAEYIAAYDASKEAVWVRKFISGLGVVPMIEEPTSMYCDNTGAIIIANESGITKGARHFCAKVHYLREVIEFGDIKLKKVHTNDNLTDPFTKALAFPKHSEHTRNIRMLPASSLM
ncbi:hypothetical protein Tco_0535720 [Tanacetum coccineum]